MLLAGDAEGPLEALLVRAYGDILRSTLLKAGHHGAETSTSGAFLNVVCPAHVVLSVGALNAFGHPSPVVLDRLAVAGIAVARTDVDGAIILETDGKILRRVFWR